MRKNALVVKMKLIGIAGEICKGVCMEEGLLDSKKWSIKTRERQFSMADSAFYLYLFYSISPLLRKEKPKCNNYTRTPYTTPTVQFYINYEH